MPSRFATLLAVLLVTGACRGPEPAVSPAPAPTGQSAAAWTAPPPANPVDPQIDAVVPPPGTPKWKRFALVVGLIHMAGHQELAPSGEQARVILESLEGLRADDGVNDYLFTTLLQTLTEEQVRYMAANVKRPAGACTCPCTTWDPLLVRAGRLLEKRAGGPAEPLAIPQDLDAWEAEQVEDLEALYRAPDTLILLQGITEVEALNGLQVTPDQARSLLPLLDGMAATLADIEQRMQAVEASLSEQQRRYIEAEGQAWFDPAATSADLNERWEGWLAEAIDHMARLSGASPQAMAP